jgi:hypothetical protein
MFEEQTKEYEVPNAETGDPVLVIRRFSEHEKRIGACSFRDGWRIPPGFLLPSLDHGRKLKKLFSICLVSSQNSTRELFDGKSEVRRLINNCKSQKKCISEMLVAVSYCGFGMIMKEVRILMEDVRIVMEIFRMIKGNF